VETFLEKVAELKKKELKKDREYIKFLENKVSERKIFSSFKESLEKPGIRIIAEIKKASPSKGVIKEVNVSKQAKIYEKGGAAAISVLTENFYFKGSLKDLESVRSSVNIPLLRKDFIFDEVQILEAKAFGADAVLLIVRMLSPYRLRRLINFSKEIGISPLVEIFSPQEAKTALEAGAEIVGVNSRDLNSFQINTSLLFEIPPLLKEMGAELVVAESGIKTKDQIEELLKVGVDAFLIGTALMESRDPFSKLRELIGI